MQDPLGAAVSVDPAVQREHLTFGDASHRLDGGPTSFELPHGVEVDLEARNPRSGTDTVPGGPDISGRISSLTCLTQG